MTGDALLRVEASRVSLIALYEDVLRSIPAALVTYTAEGLVVRHRAGRSGGVVGPRSLRCQPPQL